MIIQVVERHLLSGLRLIFHPDWLFDEDLFTKIAHDPDYEKRKKKRDALAGKWKSLRSNIASLDDLERLI